MGIIKGKIPLLILALISLSASVSLVNTTLSRNSFFLATTVLLIAYLTTYKKSLFSPYQIIAIGLLLISASQAVWLLRFPETNITGSFSQYKETSLRLFMGSLFIFSIPFLLKNANKKTIDIMAKIMIIGFFYSSIFSFYLFYKEPEGRLSINTVATMSAYIYLLQTLVTLSCLVSLDIKSKLKNLTFLLVIIISASVLSLTETRSTLLLYPVLLILYCLKSKTLSKVDFKKILLVIIPIILITLSSHSATNRIIGIFSEVHSYDSGNNDTSIGARISMWKAGINTIEQNPFGTSAYNRYQMNTAYINKYEHGNPEAIANLKYHLHNDMIDSTSLQGISGSIALMIFFGLLIFISAKYKQLSLLFFVALPVITLGLTDTLFIDYRFATTISILIAIHILLQESNKDSHMEIL